jgi:hypothetical protein
MTDLQLGAEILALGALVTLPLWVLMLCERRLGRRR